jgi:hypothetical protein
VAKLGRMLLVFLLAGGAFAGDQSAERRSWKKAWLLSMAALAGSSALDGWSSIGGSESNPLLRNSRGQFSAARGAELKSTAVGGTVALELLFSRHRPEARKASAIVNFIAAGGVGGVAIRNRTQ